MQRCNPGVAPAARQKATAKLASARSFSFLSNSIYKWGLGLLFGIGVNTGCHQASASQPLLAHRVTAKSQLAPFVPQPSVSRPNDSRPNEEHQAAKLSLRNKFSEEKSSGSTGELKRAPEPAVHWVLPMDYGIRADRAGQGQFLAPRFHGKHNGVDLLAPVGTPVLAACSGVATAGVMRGYGKWVKLVCELPEGWGQGYMSLFYSHLSEQAVRSAPMQVTLGTPLGEVGKTGNAAADAIMPHLHLELTVHPDLASARAETHSGRDQSNTKAASQLMAELEERCIEPHGLTSRFDLRRKRRLDPYVVLGCLGVIKPSFELAAGELEGSGLGWRSTYSARSPESQPAFQVLASAPGDKARSKASSAYFPLPAAQPLPSEYSFLEEIFVKQPSARNQERQERGTTGSKENSRRNYN